MMELKTKVIMQSMDTNELWFWLQSVIHFHGGRENLDLRYQSEHLELYSHINVLLSKAYEIGKQRAERARCGE